MSKLIAPIHPKWLYRSDEVAHIIKLWASLKNDIVDTDRLENLLFGLTALDFHD